MFSAKLNDIGDPLPIPGQRLLVSGTEAGEFAAAWKRPVRPLAQLDRIVMQPPLVCRKRPFEIQPGGQHMRMLESQIRAPAQEAASPTVAERPLVSGVLPLQTHVVDAGQKQDRSRSSGTRIWRSR